MSGPRRIAGGLVIDRTRPVSFQFDGQVLGGFSGDTLASALLANGRRVVARSFKYHRPRGVVAAGPEEPNALVELEGPQGREPNVLATTLPLYEGLTAAGQNAWPSVSVDVGAVNDAISRLLPAGFYYKSFMFPARAWERLYEPLIRRAAGLGRLEARVDAAPPAAQTVHVHADVLVVGAGTAGLCAALACAAAGREVLLLEQDLIAGAGALLDDRWTGWCERALAVLGKMPGVRLLTRTTLLAAYGQGVFTALQTLPGAPTRGDPRERLHVIRARSVVLATGALERLIAFPGNDVPGVMLAGGAGQYLRRYGVAVGERPLWFLNNDEAYEAVFAHHAAGLGSAGIVDVRESGLAMRRAREFGIPVLANARIVAVAGRQAVRGATVETDAGRRHVEADALLMSGGHSPSLALATQLGLGSRWQEEIAAFVPDEPGAGADARSDAGAAAGAAGASADTAVVKLAGAVRGTTGLAAAARDGLAAAASLLGDGVPVGGGNAELRDLFASLPSDLPHTPLRAIWEVHGRGKSFVDLQQDVTTEDVRLAAREGYGHPEHLKRYTTLGMGTEQGRIGALVGLAVLAQARGLPPAQLALTRPRPFAQPVPFAALAGAEARQHFKPRRRLPLHDWHESAGARFVNIGLWLRPLVYSREPGWAPVLAEARAVRERVGLTDVSTLGKIDVQGADAGRFLDFVYANRFSTLPVGRARYGIMLREDGLMFDDGTVARLGAGHFVLTTTTANAAAVLDHLDFQRQAHAAQLGVVLTDVGDAWAQFALAGPRSRAVAARVIDGLDLSNAAFPFMAAAQATIAGIAGRVFRISFSGECAYEIAVPAHHARPVWQALMQEGESEGIAAYGLDALNTLRIEKGHVTGAELTGNASADDLGFAGLPKGDGDFVGRDAARRGALNAAERLQLVALRPVERGLRLRNGAQLVTRSRPRDSLGYITSATPSVVIEGWVGLAMLAGGRRRIGEQLIAASPVHDEHVEVEVISPHWLDAENARVKG
ncbi:MAG: 2Fe-2S iron-sulfur cluster-binding protein [Steroidobacteraceae bacterium]